MTIVARVFRGLWWLLDGFRKVVHLLLLLFIVVVVVALLSHHGPAVPRTGVLYVAPQGSLVDQLSGDPVQRALAKVRRQPIAETRVKDLIDAIDDGAVDPHIKALVLRLDGMGNAGLSKLQRVAQAIDKFKAAGKPVFALGDNFDRDQYFLAAQADKIYMHPMGSVLIEGYGRYLPYYKDLLAKLYVDYNVWRVGEFKSFVEPITRNGMSDADKEESRAYLDELWSSYQAAVTSARKLPPDALQHYADDIPALLRQAGGDMAELALNYGLVDGLLSHDAMRERVTEAVEPEQARGQGKAANAASPPPVPFIDYAQYLAVARTRAPASASAHDKVAVVTLVGDILDGTQPPGSIGSDTAADEIREAAVDPRVKALVLHVDSPGGSAFAAAVILHEIQRFQKTGRPVVVSMDSVAASGGYWLSMAADEIWANPTTLTGSIGVGATLPTFEDTLAKLGVHVDGIGTTALSGQYMQTRKLGDNVKDMLHQSIDYTYQRFITQVAMYRGLGVQDVDRIARGRVWTGAAAVKLDLVDKLGDLDDAIQSAARMAGLAPDAYAVKYIQPRLTLGERLAMRAINVSAPVLRGMDIGSLWAKPLASLPFGNLVRTIRTSLTQLARWNDPRGIYAYCFCAVR